MNAKDFFERGRLLSAEIIALTQAKTIAYSEATKITGAMRDTVVQSSHEDRRTDAVLKYTELKAEINSKLTALFEIKKEIFNFIEGIDDPKCRCVLVNRYLNGFTFSKIAELMCCEERWVYRIHKKALKISDELLSAAQ